MEVSFKQYLVDFNGVILKTDKQQSLTLRIATVNALLAQFADEVSLSGEEKMVRFELALKINSELDPVTITAEEIALIKKLIAKAYATLIVGQAWKLLEKEKN